jgi:PAS domain S-box-containing protein
MLASPRGCHSQVIVSNAGMSRLPSIDFREIFEQAAVGFVHLSRNRKFLECNRAFQELVGYSQAELLQMELADLSTEEDRTRETELVRHMIASGASSCRLEKRYRHKNGRVVWVDLTISLVRADDGTVDSYLGIAKDISNRIAAETEGHENELRYRTLAEHAPDAIFIIGADYTIRYANAAAASMLGLPSEALVGKSEQQLFPPEVSARHAQSISEVFASGTQLVREDCIPGGEHELWLETKLLPIVDATGRINSIFGLSRDITERKQSEAEAARWRQRYELVTEASGQVVYDYDVPTGSIIWSGSIHSVLGYEAAEMAGGIGQWTSMIHPDDREAATRELDHCEKEMRPYDIEYRFIHKSGRWIWIHDRGFFATGDTGNVCRMVGTMTDISARVEAEATLMEKEKLYRMLFDISPAGILVEDAEGRILDANEAIRQSFGYTREELIGTSVYKLASPENHELIASNIAAILDGNVLRHEVENRRKDGSQSWMELRETSMLLPSGERGILCVGNDVTERKRVETELIAAKERAERSDQLKDAFIANMSHEIRTPLNVIIGYNDLIAELYSDAMRDEHVDYMQSIERSGKRLLRTMEHILNISSIQVGTFRVHYERVDVLSTAEALLLDLQPIASAKGLALVYEPSCDGPLCILADRYSLEQALSNLLDNAIKFTQRGGVTIEVSRNEARACIAVRDTGIGISDKYLPNIFEKFSQERHGTTRPFEGLGLGMALTKHYVEVNNGMISIESTPGSGTSASMSFPIEKTNVPPEADEAPGASRPQPETTRRHLLVVEDDVQSQQYMKILLSKHFAVQVSSTAKDAWRILHESTINLVLMDISLHGEIDGLQLTRMIREDEALRTLPVIALTAHAFPADRQKSIDAGCTDYLSKPFQREQLLTIIEKHIAH